MKDLVLAVAIGAFLGLHGYRKKSLALSGAVTAFAVGVLTLAGGMKAFGITLISFYLLGSRATKYGKQRKAKYEAEYVEAGYRSGWQVLCNCIWAVGAAVLWNGIYVPGSIQALVTGGLLVGGKVHHGDAWCAVGGGNGWSRGLVFAALGHYGCCFGDTLASELGILSGEEPRLVTTFRKVPRGTNGGMSAFGTFCSVAGGALIGLIMGTSVVLENGACGAGAVVAEMVGWGAFAGGFGSLVDSVLGATVQQTRYSAERKQITERGGDAINGWDILTNNQVNLLSGLISTIVVGWMTSS